ncbi:hypothetical protein [Burkholderia cepacia]|uniref:hypothetical protein n=1 Tax=Burkholderia cepacia TaxID=292 RepID=UPI00264FE25A|nr:hypothetical protein [Burkholderia cepacia]MDN7909914.1 hypothetical protein [Burkholderia cepacia]
MAMKKYALGPEVVQEAQRLGFTSVNQYVKHLMKFREEHQRLEEESMVKIFNRTIAFLELERMTMHRTAEALHVLLKKTTSICSYPIELELRIAKNDKKFKITDLPTF